MEWNDFDRLMRRIEGSFTVALITQKLTILPSEITCAAVGRFARDNRFSQVAYRCRDTEGKERLKIGEFDSENNYEPVGEPRDLAEEDILADGTPLGEAFELLDQRPFYLVLVRNRVECVITASDLNRLPVRSYLFTLLAHAEALLTEWIMLQYPGESFLEKLGPKGQTRVRALHSDKIAQDKDTRLIDCTTLTDKLVVVEKTESMWGALGYADIAKYKDARKRFNRLRGRLHHGMTLIPAHEEVGLKDGGSEEAHDESDALRDALAHNGQLVWNSEDVRWLATCVKQIGDWIPKMTQNLQQALPR